MHMSSEQKRQDYHAERMCPEVERVLDLAYYHCELSRYSCRVMKGHMMRLHTSPWSYHQDAKN